MKVATLKARVEKYNNKNGSTPKNNDYKKAIDILTSNGAKVHIGYYQGYSPKTYNPMFYLNNWGIDYTSDNDAPRGGVLGNFITLTSKGKRQCKEYYEAYREQLRLANIKHEEAKLRIALAKEEAERILLEEIEVVTNLVDEEFTNRKTEALLLSGKEKSDMLTMALTDLLKRYDLFIVNFYKVLRKL